MMYHSCWRRQPVKCGRTDECHAPSPLDVKRGFVPSFTPRTEHDLRTPLAPVAACYAPPGSWSGGTPDIPRRTAITPGRAAFLLSTAGRFFSHPAVFGDCQPVPYGDATTPAALRSPPGLRKQSARRTANATAPAADAEQPPATASPSSGDCQPARYERHSAPPRQSARLSTVSAPELRTPLNRARRSGPSSERPGNRNCSRHGTACDGQPVLGCGQPSCCGQHNTPLPPPTHPRRLSAHLPQPPTTPRRDSPERVFVSLDFGCVLVVVLGTLVPVFGGGENRKCWSAPAPDPNLSFTKKEEFRSKQASTAQSGLGVRERNSVVTLKGLSHSLGKAE